MGIIRQLRHWSGGNGPRLSVHEFVPLDHPLRLWADTFPWLEMTEAMEQSFQRRFPKNTEGGRFPISSRVLLALEVLKHELSCSDEQR